MTVYTYGTPFDAKPIANDTAVAGSTQAFAINDQGVIVGSYLSTSGVLRGFMGSASSVITILADNAATGVTNSQWVVGYYYDSHSIAHGFQILGSIYAQVDEPNATGGTILNGINSSDVLVGTFEDQFGNHGFRRNADLTYTYFDYFPGRTFLQAINDAGLIVGYYGDGNNHTHGLLYNPSGGYTVLDDPSATNATFLNGINNAGQIVGTYNASDGAHSFIYSGGFFTTIPDPANGHFFASGINNNGQIVGTLYDNTGEHGVVVSPTSNPAPPAATTADMILSATAAATQYNIFDIGNNTVLAAYTLGQVGAEWRFAGLGGFSGSDTSDMILRNRNSGAFEVYDISNNNITNATAMGQVGLEWQIAGFGDFSSRIGETDMMMRDNTGKFEIYDISNNAITSAAPMGQIGLEWQVAGFGDFSTRPNESDMLMRNVHTGAFQLYDISGNSISSTGLMGQVGLEWSVAGFGDFSGRANETDMLMRDSMTGQFEIYDIANNGIFMTAGMGQVGLEWQVVGFGPISGAGASDMLMRNSNTGAFEAYDIRNNQIMAATPMGQVGPEWSVAGLAADPPSGAAPSLLTQAASAFASSNAVPDASAALSPVAMSAADMSSLAGSADILHQG